MHVTRSMSHRARAGLAAAVAVTALGVPALAAPAVAVPAAGTATAVSSACANAQSALTQARRQQRATKANLLKARKVLRKAKAAHQPAKVRKAKKAVDRIGKRYRALTRTANYRAGRADAACAPAPAPTTEETKAGRALGLLALGSGLSTDALDLSQLTAVLDQLLPGLAEQLSPAQLTAILSGFNAISSGDFDPADLLAGLAGGFNPADITALLGGLADPALLQSLAGSLLSQFNGLAGGGFELPGMFDPTSLLTTFAALFGQLDPGQLGQLLALITSATGGDPAAFDLTMLTGLIDALVPGISDAFDPAQLTSLLSAFKTVALSPATLATLLGGQFSPLQLGGVLAGTAPDALIGAVISQVMAQLATAGGGGLQLPTGLGLEALTGLVGTVTDLLDALTGGGVIPVICGIIPLPILCG